MLRINLLTEIQDYIDLHLAPAVAKHGGSIEITEFMNGKLKLSLGGSCSLCSLDTQTTAWIKTSVETEFPDLTECIVTVTRENNFELRIGSET